MRNNRKLVHNNEGIVLEFFRLIKNKDVGNLMDLFDSEAIVYEPFSKITGGLKGKLAIESFVRVAMMANDTLQHRIVIVKKSNPNELKSDYKVSDGNNSDNTKFMTALVRFEKGDSVRARFTFELASDNSDSDDDGGGAVGRRYNRIKSLHIQFLK